MADALTSVAHRTSAATSPVAYAVGLGGACLLAWIAASVLIGAPPPYHRPGDYTGPLHWTVAWLWLAPLPYVFAWFFLVSRHLTRAFLALAILGVLTGAVAPVAGMALLGLGPLVIMGSVPVAMLFGVVMAALQDDVPPGLADEWQGAHVKGCFLALAPYSLAMAAFYAMTLSPGGAPGRVVQTVLPLAVLAVGWCFHAAWCWRLLSPARRGAVPWWRVAVLLSVFGIAVLAALARA
ncbi:hypothetical protein GXW78_05735 [Roseomonas terrae]|jgi:hypothetical protein|uniref:Uncharacterized protein n=1 Tax=Neoroseomonas terrae TaxID=424799 RepID=A0ABS5EDS0_9PROT|nr:hypothetical protein [Neoroseomonas terrae]MBR0649154.1 hypothetical protein [Neoroseomonas terrae]